MQKKKKSRKGKLVEIVWEDACTQTEWTPLPSIVYKPAIIHSVGWVLHDLPMALLIAQSIDVENHNASEILQVPLAYIKKIRVIGS